MAQTIFDSNNNAALIQQLWAKKLLAASLPQAVVGKFTGTTSSSMIQMRDELTKSAGDTVTYGLRYQLSGLGVSGDGTLKGNEEAMSFASQSLIIDQLRHAVEWKGSMSAQRVAWDYREEAKSGLADWWKARWDVSAIAQLAGLQTPSTGLPSNATNPDVRYTGMQAAIAPDTNHWISGTATASTILYPATQSTEALDMVATNTFNLAYIDLAVVTARTLTPPIRPVNINGRDLYLCFIHPQQAYDLKTKVSTSAVNWTGIQTASLQGGKLDNHPFWTGALGIYNQTLIFEDARIPYCPKSNATLFNITNNAINLGYTTNVTLGKARAIFCGAQALMFGLGRAHPSAETFKWVEELDDYNNQYGISASLIYGMKKTRFTPPGGSAADFGTIVISTPTTN